MRGAWLLIWQLLCTARRGQSDTLNLVARARSNVNPATIRLAPARGEAGFGPPATRQPHAATSSAAITAGGGACRGRAGGGDKPTAEPHHRGCGGVRASPAGRPEHQPAAPDWPTPRRCARRGTRAVGRAGRRRASTTELAACAVTHPPLPLCYRTCHTDAVALGNGAPAAVTVTTAAVGVAAATAVVLASTSPPPAPIPCPERAPGDNHFGCTCRQRQRHTKGG